VGECDDGFLNDNRAPAIEEADVAAALDLVFEAVAEATEEAVLDALWAAETTDGRLGRVLHAPPAERVLLELRRPRIA
jgi:L-aminopeptidase/D-esterase-like protein